jgi:hypothetical protein
MKNHREPAELKKETLEPLPTHHGKRGRLNSGKDERIFRRGKPRPTPVYAALRKQYVNATNSSSEISLAMEIRSIC